MLSRKDSGRSHFIHDLFTIESACAKHATDGMARRAIVKRLGSSIGRRRPCDPLTMLLPHRGVLTMAWSFAPERITERVPPGARRRMCLPKDRRASAAQRCGV